MRAKTKELISWSLLLIRSRRKDEQMRSAWRAFCEARLESGAFLAGEKLGPADLVAAFVAHRLSVKFGSPVAHRWLETVHNYSLPGNYQKVRLCDIALLLNK